MIAASLELKGGDVFELRPGYTLTDSKIILIQIKKRGKFNDEGQYWPIRARFVVSYRVLETDRTVVFDRVGNFKISQDEYGEWNVSEFDVYSGD